ncbi:MAG: NAD(+)/NADH kinase [Fibrobacterota bacterium]
MNRKSFGIIGFSRKKEIKAAVSEISSVLSGIECDVFFHEVLKRHRIPGYKYYSDTQFQKKADFIISVGGDGTLLSAASMVLKRKIPIIGLNIGELGFLTEFSLSEFKNEIKMVLENKTRLSRRKRLETKVFRGKKEIYCDSALNEVVIYRKGGNVVNLSVNLENDLLGSYNADGIIISTPTGSTAYSLSCGGPILYPSLDCFLLNPISPHSLTERPVIFPSDKELEVTIKKSRVQAMVSADGKKGVTLKMGDRVIVKKSEYETLIVSLPMIEYSQLLRNKLGWCPDR